MPLQLGQILYTSFTGRGFRSFASKLVPPESETIFIKSIIHQHWNSYNPLATGSRGCYLHQISQEQTLFGWIYNEGDDDFGRDHTPYFICYYISAKLGNILLDIIFNCLERGPIKFWGRQSMPNSLDDIEIPDSCNYKPAKTGVPIPLGLRTLNLALHAHGKLLHLNVKNNSLGDREQGKVSAQIKRGSQSFSESQSINLAEDVGLLNSYHPGLEVERLALRFACVELYTGDPIKQIEAEKRFLRDAVKKRYQNRPVPSDAAVSKVDVRSSEVKRITLQTLTFIVCLYYIRKWLIVILLGRDFVKPAPITLSYHP